MGQVTESENGSGNCTWPYAIVNGVRTHISAATRMQHGICPVCGAELVARKGKFRAAHWWHVNGRRCDSWYQPKGPWHRYWQNMFPEDWQEVVLERMVDGQFVRHIADIRTKGGIVVEVQYSPISIESINEREHFYENMLWIVNMRRVESDLWLETHIKRTEHLIEKNSVRTWVLDDSELMMQQKWCYAHKPVVFDFDGFFDRPESEKSLVCLLPQGDMFKERVCVEVERKRLIALLRKGCVGQLFRQWKEMSSDIIELYRIDKENRMREESERREREKRKAERQMREHEEWMKKKRKEREKLSESVSQLLVQEGVSDERRERFLSGHFDCRSRFVLSLGWVETYLISQDKMYDIAGVPTTDIKIPEMGRVVLCYRPDYSLEDFKRDVQKAEQLFGLSVSQTLDFEKMHKLSGKVVAAVNYFRLKDAEHDGFLLCGARKLRRNFDLKNPADGFSQLSKAQSSYFSAYDPVYAPRGYL